MAGDTKANKANTNNRQGVQLSASTKRSEKDLIRARSLSGQAKVAAENIIRRKRAVDRASRGR